MKHEYKQSRFGFAVVEDNLTSIFDKQVHYFASLDITIIIFINLLAQLQTHEGYSAYTLVRF